MSTSGKCSERLIATFAAVLALGCSPHEQPEHEATPGPEPEPLGVPASTARSYPAPPPRPTRPPRPAARQEPPQTTARPLLAKSPPGPAAFLVSKTDVIRLDDSGFSRIWFGPVSELIAGFDGRLYLRDPAGVHVLGEDALRTHIAFDDHEELQAATNHAIGPYGELWLLLPPRSTYHDRFNIDDAPSPVRIDADGTAMRWTDPNETGIEHFVAMAVDGDGRAWIVLADHGLLHKSRDAWWQRVQSWELGKELPTVPRAFVDAQGDARGGLVLLSKTELIHVTAEPKIHRTTLPESKPRQLLLGRGREAVVAADCRLYRYDLDHLESAPTEIQTSAESCTQTLAAIDERGRVWQLDGNVGRVDGDDGATTLELARLSDWDTRQIIVVGDGPSLASAVDGRIVPERLPSPYDWKPPK